MRPTSTSQTYETEKYLRLSDSSTAAEEADDEGKDSSANEDPGDDLYDILTQAKVYRLSDIRHPPVHLNPHAQREHTKTDQLSNSIKH